MEEIYYKSSMLFSLYLDMTASVFTFMEKYTLLLRTQSTVVSDACYIYVYIYCSAI